MPDTKKRIMLVDDEPNTLQALGRSLRRQNHEWEFSWAERAAAAWEQLLQTPHDAVVTDIKMPGMSGLELLQRLQTTEATSDLPVVVMTGLTEQGLREKALELGAADLLTKPVDSRHLVARLQNVLRYKAREDRLRADNRVLRQTLQQQRALLRRSRLDVVCRLGSAAEYRDTDTGNHVIRVGCFSRTVAKGLGLEGHLVELLLLAAPLHDVGKIAIPDAILLKPGPLTPGEWAVMQRHCAFGERILRARSRFIAPLLENLGEPLDNASPHDPLLDLAGTIALTHHEKWDGTGYPWGLSGHDMPLASRIVAICDVFDALTSHRPYKPAGTEEEALALLAQASGSHFDPEVHAAFVRVFPEIRRLRQRFADGIRPFDDFDEP